MRRIGREEGYNLVVLAMIVTVLSIFVAASIPVWSHATQREKEEELIFRGLQYAEAIRVFQARYGRPPTRLEELVETSPRCIRQLWKDPMTEDGEWGLMFGQPQQQQPGAQRRGRRGPQQANPNGLDGVDFGSRPEAVQVRGPGAQPRETGLTGERRQTGPIIGVHSLSDKESIRTFDGAEVYNEWVFAVEKVPTPAVNPTNGQLSGANDRWVGRPFPEGIEPQSGSGPGDQEKEEDPFSDRSNRNPLDRDGAFGSGSGGAGFGSGGFGGGNSRGNRNDQRE